MRHPDPHYSYQQQYTNIIWLSNLISEPCSTQNPQSISTGQALCPKEGDTFPIFFI
jgi:hypothetical protein